MPRVNRYREQLRQRFPWFLARWLAKLPADGWEGTSRELWEAMTAKARRFDRIPATNALLAAIELHTETVPPPGVGFAAVAPPAPGWSWSNGSLIHAEVRRRTPAVLGRSKTVA